MTAFSSEEGYRRGRADVDEGEMVLRQERPQWKMVYEELGDGGSS